MKYTKRLNTYFTPIEIAKEIDTNINPKKSPGYKQINPKILKELYKQRKPVADYAICRL